MVAALAFPSTGLALLLCLSETNTQLKGGKAQGDDTGKEAAPAGRKINGRERLPYTEMAQRERERDFIYLFIYCIFFIQCCKMMRLFYPGTEKSRGREGEKRRGKEQKKNENYKKRIHTSARTHSHARTPL